METTGRQRDGSAPPGPAADGSGADAGRGRTLALVMVVLAASAVVAIATRDLRLLGAPTTLAPGWTWAVRVLGAAAAAVGLSSLLAQRRSLGGAGVRGADPTVVAVRTAATIMGVLVMAALFAHPPARRHADGRGGPVSSQRGPHGRGNAGAEGPPRAAGSISGSSVLPGRPAQGEEVTGGAMTHQAADGFVGTPLQRLVRSILPFLLLLVAVMAFRAMRRGPPTMADFQLGLPLDRAEAEAGLSASLDEIARDGLDPRTQITGAYRRLLAALAAAGAQRRPQEAPHEHLHRALGPLGVRPEPLHRLTDLYVLAQFSERPITDAHRAAAARALDASLASLRAGAGPQAMYSRIHVDAEAGT